MSYLNKKTVNSTIKKLQKEDYINLVAGKYPNMHIYLTQKGKDMKKKAAEIPSCMTNDFCRCGIDPKSMEAMIPILDELLNKLSVKEED